MPVIVAFGDSNTWGYDPATGGRFPRAQRWTNVLQRELGADFEVIAEGLNGRTTVHDDSRARLQRPEEALLPFRLRHCRGGTAPHLSRPRLRRRSGRQRAETRDPAGRSPAGRPAHGLRGGVRRRRREVTAARRALSGRGGGGRRRVPRRGPGHPMLRSRRHSVRGRSARPSGAGGGEGCPRRARRLNPLSPAFDAPPPRSERAQPLPIAGAGDANDGIPAEPVGAGGFLARR
jgi:hypothetical protein